MWAADLELAMKALLELGFALVEEVGDERERGGRRQ